MFYADQEWVFVCFPLSINNSEPDFPAMYDKLESCFDDAKLVKEFSEAGLGITDFQQAIEHLTECWDGRHEDCYVGPLMKREVLMTGGMAIDNDEAPTESYQILQRLMLVPEVMVAGGFEVG